MKKVFKIDTPEQFKAIIDPIRKHIFDLAPESEFTTKDIALLLDEAPAKINYHIKEMTKAGFFKKAKTETVRNLTLQYYIKTAKTYAVSAKFNKNMQKLAKDQRKDLGEAYLLNYASMVHDDILDHINKAPCPDNAGQAIMSFKTSVYVDKKDLEEMSKAIDKVIGKYQKRAAGKKRQNIYTITLPT